MKKFFLLLFIILMATETADGWGAPKQLVKLRDKDRQHLIFWQGTPQEMEVYRIYGRLEGPTVMIIGGIQGDEPGGFLSADLYADLALKRGNLIVVPRANFKSIIMFDRGPDGDMNRKFQGDLSKDPDAGKVEIIKSLMAESDLLLNLHDGSGYYRPTWESEIANPKRYGQCIIADTDVYIHPHTGNVIPLREYARKVVDKVNQDIEEPLYKFHFFNTDTASDLSKHKEQRKSATFYALTQIGIPAFGIETSKQLPSLELKVYQHNLAVNAFLDVFGLEVEQPRIMLDPPEMSYMVISVNNALPIAVANGQSLMINEGDSIEVVHVGANYDRGLSVDVLGLGSFNDIRQPLSIKSPTTVIARKDHIKIGQVDIKLFDDKNKKQTPTLYGDVKIKAPKIGTPVTLASLEKNRKKDLQPLESGGQAPSPVNQFVSSFIVEINNKKISLKPGETLSVLRGTKVKMLDIQNDKGDSLTNMAMNLKGFVPPVKSSANDGEDRGFAADTNALMPAFSVDGKGTEYRINAEIGKEILAHASLKILTPKLESVSIEVDGQKKILKLGNRTSIAAGSKVKVLEVKLSDNLTLDHPRYSLGGRHFSSKLPQTLTMPAFAANIAVYNGECLAGKTMLVPR